MRKNSIISIFLTFIFFITFSFFSSACSKAKEKSDYDIICDFANNLEFEEELNENLTLKNLYEYEGKNISVVWESSNQNILTNDGQYFYTLEDEIVTLISTISLNEYKEEKTFEFISIANENKAFEEAFKKVQIPDKTNCSIDLLSSIKYGKNNYKIAYKSSNEDIMDNFGNITFSNEDKEITLNVTLTSNKISKTFSQKIIIEKINESLIIENLKKCINDIGLNDKINQNINLPTFITYINTNLPITWVSSNTNFFSNTGKIKQENKDITVSLKVSTILNIEYTFDICIEAINDSTSLENALKEINIPSKITSDIILSSSYTYNTFATWLSSDTSILSNEGKINKTLTEYKNITLKLILSKGASTMEKDFNVIVGNEAHLYQDRTFEGTKTNVHIEEGKLVLNKDALEGSYEGNEISVQEFTSAVGSYASTSSKNATCEYFVRIKANNIWSKYISYGKWGQGLKNASYDQSDTYVKLSTDELMLTTSNLGTSFQLKIILRRDAITYESPKVAMLALAIEYKNYTHDVNISNLPKAVKYDVYKLYQHDVPTIGNSICSATSSTMLLKYKGHDFSSLANYEHEYIAYIVKDYGNNIFGNWVYNTIAMSSFGEIAYVKRFYSSNELIYHLATVGPVAASIKGKTITNKKTYTTNGHLIVVTGYKIENNQTIIYINDPNVSGVEVEMTLENFLNVYRMVSYIIE